MSNDLMELSVTQALTHPDPDPELLPILRDEDALALTEQRAAHLLRATLKAEKSIEEMKARMRADMDAWAHEIAKAELRVGNWREMVRSFMVRAGITQIKSPWLTASIGKPRTRIVIDDELECERILSHRFNGNAIQIKTCIVKKQFDVIWNSQPKEFEAVAHEEIGEPTLVIRKKE